MHDHDPVTSCFHALRFCQACDECYCESCKSVWIRKNEASVPESQPPALSGTAFDCLLTHAC